MNDIVNELEVEREATLARIASLTRSFDDVVASIDGIGNDDEHDPEGATIAYERAQILAMLDASRTRLQSIDDAFDRIGDGSHGRCAACGQLIPLDRLRALPTTSTCVTCAPSWGPVGPLATPWCRRSAPRPRRR